MNPSNYRVKNNITNKILDKDILKGLPVTLFSAPDYEITESTGIFDINGVEIFEGDTLEIYTKELDRLDKFKVAWSENFLCFYLKGDEDIYCLNWKELTGNGSYVKVIVN